MSGANCFAWILFFVGCIISLVCIAWEEEMVTEK